MDVSIVVVSEAEQSPSMIVFLDERLPFTAAALSHRCKMSVLQQERIRGPGRIIR
jgi:hypothetical protein